MTGSVSDVSKTLPVVACVCKPAAGPLSGPSCRAEGFWLCPVMFAYFGLAVVSLYWPPQLTGCTVRALASLQPVGSQMWNEETAPHSGPRRRKERNSEEWRSQTVATHRYASSLTCFSMWAGISLISASLLLNSEAQNFVKPTQAPSTAPWWKSNAFSHLKCSQVNSNEYLFTQLTQ